MNPIRSDEVAAIKARLDHPVIDGDGHLIEFQPLVRDAIVEIAGEEVAKRFDLMATGSRLARSVPLEQRRALGMSRFAWSTRQMSMCSSSGTKKTTCRNK